MRHRSISGTTTARFLAWLPTLVSLSCQTPAPSTREQSERPPQTVVASAPAISTAASATPKAAVRPYQWLSATSARAPLVMFLHGYGASPAQSIQALELARVAKELDVHIAVPEGTPDQHGLRFWNAGGACCDFDGTGIDDVSALRAVMADIEGQHAVSSRYLVGFSNGAFMAHRMACEAADRIDGFVAFAGVGPLDPARCQPSKPLRILQIHGTADRAVRYAGGHVLGRSDVDAHPGAVDTVRFWARHNGCTEGPPHAAARAIGDRPTSTTPFTGCTKGAEVALWTVTDGGHLIGIDPPTIEAAIRFLLQP